MEQMWAPWRLDYITGEKIDGCIFCEFPKKNEDEKYLILERGKHNYIIMNAFPYSNGHLMVVPYRHLSDLAKLKTEEMQEMMELIQKCYKVIKKLSYPDGFNIGMNIGANAGAGIADHLHMHIVPRWKGDTNFMPVLAQVKIIPESLQVTYSKLKKIFDEINNE
ncbi:MAG: HIT domain-containing protein [Armatimonadota bacterium]